MSLVRAERRAQGPPPSAWTVSFNESIDRGSASHRGHPQGRYSQHDCKQPRRCHSQCKRLHDFNLAFNSWGARSIHTRENKNYPNNGESEVSTQWLRSWFTENTKVIKRNINLPHSSDGAVRWKGTCKMTTLAGTEVGLPHKGVIISEEKMAAKQGHENWQTLTRWLQNGSTPSARYKHPRFRLHSFGKVRHPTIKTFWMTRNEKKVLLNTSARRCEGRLFQADTSLLRHKDKRLRPIQAFSKKLQLWEVSQSIHSCIKQVI